MRGNDPADPPNEPGGTPAADELGGTPVEHDPFERRGLIKREDLEGILPPENRRAGTWDRGIGTLPVEGGKDWTDINMSEPESGLHASPEALQGAWDQAVEKVKSFSPEQREWMDKYLAENPEVGPNTPEFWDRALRQPKRARYWYEISTRKFQNEGLDEHLDDPKLGFQTVAATSGSAEPKQNLQRTLGVLAEHQQGLPSAIDLVSPGALRQAFGEGGTESPKFGNFGDTFAHIAGIGERPPLSTNDRQVAGIHNISPEELAKQPSLYALLSHFYQNFRDVENAARPEVAAGTENPLETWQLQAPGWTQFRGEKRAGKAGESGYDDYAQVIDRMKEELEGHGIDTSRGLFSPAVLEHPMVPNLMSGTRERFLDSPIATVETATTMTPEGARAADLLGQLQGVDTPWANKAKKALEMVQRQSMKSLASAHKGDSLISRMVSALVGEPADVSRIDPKGGWGQFEGDISPNMRIPMWARLKRSGERVTLEPEQINALLGALGSDLGQRAMAASRFRTIAPEESPLVMPKTFSVFLPERGLPPTPLPQLDQFGRELGLPLNITRGPTGTLADINIGGFEDRMPTREQVLGAAERAFAELPYNLLHRDYQSHYLEHPDLPETAPELSYDTHLRNFWDREHAADQGIRADDAGRVRGADWSAARRAGDFDTARQEVRAIAEAQRVATQKWIDDYARRIENPEPTRGQRALKRGAGGQIAAAQAAQPPPGEIPVEHDPFAVAAE